MKNAWVFYWNPKSSQYTDGDFKKRMKEMRNPNQYVDDFPWRINKREHFEQFDHLDFFIIVQVGTEYDGIVAVGTVFNGAYACADIKCPKAKRWFKLDELTEEEKQTMPLYVDLEPDFMIRRDTKDLFFSAEELEKKYPQIDWHNGTGERLIPLEILEDFVIDIAVVLCNQKKNEPPFSYEDFYELTQGVGTYLDGCCPKFKQRLIAEREPVQIWSTPSPLTPEEISVFVLVDAIEKCEKITKENLIEFFCPEI